MTHSCGVRRGKHRVRDQNLINLGRVMRSLILVKTFAILVFFASAAFPQSGWQTIGDVSSFEKRADGIEIRAQRGHVRLSVLSPTVVRVRYSLQGKFSERPSFAVLPGAFQGAVPALQVEDSAQQLSLSTGALVVRIEKSALRIAFQDRQNLLRAKSLVSRRSFKNQLSRSRLKAIQRVR